MKPTDEERREVASEMRQRGYEGYLFVSAPVALELGVDIDDYGEDFDSFSEDAWNRLADLVEPLFRPCEETEEWLDSIKREGQPKTVRDVIEDIIWTCSTADIGPNGNVSSSGVDEGIVSTDALISAWEGQLADLIDPAPERMCRAEVLRCREDDGSQSACLVCSECGEKLRYREAAADDGEPDYELLPYCAGCGAKVVYE